MKIKTTSMAVMALLGVNHAVQVKTTNKASYKVPDIINMLADPVSDETVVETPETIPTTEEAPTTEAATNEVTITEVTPEASTANATELLEGSGAVKSTNAASLSSPFKFDCCDKDS